MGWASTQRISSGRLRPVEEAVENRVENRTLINDPQVMRALAHPARMAILEEMHAGKVGTATDFAQLCGLSPSATSYHLRALAKVGLVCEAPGRGDARERVWRSVATGGLEVGAGPTADVETQQAEQELVTVFLAREEARARAWLTRWPDETQEWYEAAALSEAVVMVTASELNALNSQVYALLGQYSVAKRTDAPAGARRVSVTYRAIPVVDAAPNVDQPGGAEEEHSTPR